MYANSTASLSSSLLCWLFFDLGPRDFDAQRFESCKILSHLCYSYAVPKSPPWTEEYCSILSFALFVPNCYLSFPFHIVVFLLESFPLKRYAKIRWDHNQASLPQKRQRTRQLPPSQGLLPRASNKMRRTRNDLSQNRAVSGM